MTGLLIRDETPADQKAIFDLTTAAFEPMPFSNGSEPRIIDGLRKDGDLTLSLVAVEVTDEGGDIVGHIAFSPVTIDGLDDHWYGLGPVSVAASKQRRGIGKALIHEGLRRLKSHSAKGCVLIGNPDYYGRFGFKNDGKVTYGDVPDKFVQWLSFTGTPPRGNIRYSPAFEG